MPDVPDTHSPSELKARPYSCELPGHLITVEGRDLVDGKGYCGARAGAQVRVLVDGKPVAYDFGSEVKSKPSSAALLRDGWIELSDCFERSHSVTVSSTGSSVRVELCRVAAGDAEPDTSFVPLRGACKAAGHDLTQRSSTKTEREERVPVRQFRQFEPLSSGRVRTKATLANKL